MREVLQELAERIRGEVQDLEQVVQRVQEAWPQAQRRSPEQQVYVDSVALNLHGFYSGIERLFELIARHLDQAIPRNRTWHRDLLHQMVQEVQEVRPAVISPHSGEALDAFRRFRHLIRNVYAMNLVPSRMAGLMVALPEVWHQLRAELLAFADFLEEMGGMDSAGEAR